jgi:hypothetical protein
MHQANKNLIGYQAVKAKAKIKRSKDRSLVALDSSYRGIGYIRESQIAPAPVQTLNTPRNIPCH